MQQPPRKAPQPPTHNVCVQREGVKTWHPVGVGWMNDYGAITIKLNPMVDLGRMGPLDHLKLFPKDYNRNMGPRSGPTKSNPDTQDPPPGAEEPPDFGDDDIPF